MISETPSAGRQIARAAGLVMSAFVFSQLAGLVRQILIADAFGTSTDMDAFNVANRVAETLFNLVAGGALGSAFIPTFTELLTKEKKCEAWQLASAVGNWVLVILIALSILIAIFAPQVVRYILAPGFAENPAQEALTIHLLRLMLPSAALFGLSGLVMGILNSHQVFFIPALTPSMYQFGMIFGVLVLAPRMGIDGLAWGVVFGAAAHLLLQLPTLVKQGGSYSPTFGLKLAPVREVVRLMGPRLLGVAVVQLNFWVNIRLASEMQEGSVTGVTFAFILMLMPQAAIAQSIATAAMPTLAAQYARGKLEDVRSSLVASLRGVLLLSIPASIGLILLREPIITLLYQRGEFTERSTELVAWALLWYAAGLVGHSVMEVLSRAFYALHDTKTPVIVGMIAMSLNVVFSFAFAALFRQIGWMPHGGLALANSLATALETVALIILMRRRLGGLEGRNILQGALKGIISGAIMGLSLWGWLIYFESRSAWLVGVGGIALGGVVYGVTAMVLRVKEIQRGLGIIQQRLFQKGS
ncbi:MAG: murein biosynthesis integral membrane protein MurJ [Anaerolineales bacterium]|nr:murein biosynthesis integral membrane protein MurJ [Chloroflexota bacterium]MBL6981555.1 murein biosynthesis integral membrane protein MurJ [Anaerolineales bacterium]